MKEIRGTASAVVPTPANACYALLSAVGRYHEWNSRLIRELEVLQHDPPRLRAVIRVGRSRLTKSFELSVEVRTEPPRAVVITRIPNEPDDPEALELGWRVAPVASASRLELEVRALASSVPSFLPVGGLGDLIARTLLRCATEALEETA
jgi:ribosome-associated toxin RatA of RatAB toxin-antitoxin module